ncbi:MAG: hypothetical protein R3F31_11990 [Verrucomicrobiales bacterium]|nr:hypothetical protein [Verrucomicrobiae bacterium]HRX56134.1 hypothetical protein [Verrucomicrobiales bacterium]
MKTIVVACFIAFLMQAAEPHILNLWPAIPPEPAAKVEGAERDLTKPEDKLIAGLPIIKPGHVRTPQMQVFPPDKAEANGGAGLFCPGGGISILAWDLDGTEMAEWMNSLGLALQCRVWLGDQPRFGKAEHRADKIWPLHAMMDEPGHNNQPCDSTRTLPQLIADLKARPCDVPVLANPLEMLADEDIDVSYARTLDFLSDEARRKQARLALARPDSILLGDTAKGHPAIGSIYLNLCCFLFDRERRGPHYFAGIPVSRL